MSRAGEVPAPDQRGCRYEQVHAMVQSLKGFYFNAGAFVVINIAVFAISAPTGGLAGGVWWFYWPLIGWGIGLGAHALGVFGVSDGGGPLGRDWEERKIRKLMDKERGS